MRYGSVCSGIEAATAAWHPLGWKASFFSEIEAFPRSVLAHHYPETPLHGDFTTIKAGEYEPIDLLVGGTPCQSFSVAGLRGGLDDDRGNLALEYLRLADRLRPRWLVWENVPGVLSSNGGRDFGAILGGMVELGYGVAYRVLDAQFFGVAQRRRRVFVVGYLGDWRRAAAVLFERHSLSGNPAPRREAGKAAPTIPSRSTGGGGLGTDFDCDGGLIAAEVAETLRAGGNRTGGDRPPGTDADTAGTYLIAHTLKGEGFDASEDGTGRGQPIVPVCFSSKDHGADALDDLSPTLRAGGHDGSHANAGVPPAIAFSIMPMNSGKDFKGRETDVAQPVMAAGPAGPAGGNQGGDYIVQPAIAFQPGNLRRGVGAPPSEAVFPTLKSDHGRGLSDQHPHVAVAFNARQDPGSGPVADARGTRDTGHGIMLPSSAVRRLTPRECERLQGFPDDFTLVPHRGKPAADGPRYKALGNSMAVPCMAWIGQRIQAVEDLAKTLPVNDTAPQPKERAA
jgi:DNA (cytosine-5)-methyltransferase 1